MTSKNRVQEGRLTEKSMENVIVGLKLRFKQRLYFFHINIIIRLQVLKVTILLVVHVVLTD